MEVVQPERGQQFVSGRCMECRGPVRLDIETDGNGLLIEYVHPCQRCLESMATRLAKILAVQYGQNGGGTAPGSTTCPDCGETRPRVPRGPRLARCEKCRKVATALYHKQYTRRAVVKTVRCPRCGANWLRKKWERAPGGFRTCDPCSKLLQAVKNGGPSEQSRPNRNVLQVGRQNERSTAANNAGNDREAPARPPGRIQAPAGGA